MWEFVFEEFPLLKKEFPLLLNKKWELNLELKVGIVDKKDLSRSWSLKWGFKWDFWNPTLRKRGPKI